MIVYVSNISYGYGDSHDQKTVYAGTDHTAAVESLKCTGFPEPENNFGWVEHWRDGHKERDEYIIE